jgi:D-apiose dehydrogenase
MKKLRFAVFGCGFWSNYQIPGWLELEGVELAAVYNRTRSKAESISAKFGHVPVYDDPVKMLDTEEIDFVDIITDIETHYKFAELAASKGYDVVCQKPMAPSYDLAQKLVQVCDDNHVKLFVNENFRFQAPIRKVKEIIESGIIGNVFKARITFCSAFPLYDSQSYMTELDMFILVDIGSHILDISRYLFGDPRLLFCQTHTVNPKIKGEDVANVFMHMQNGVDCFVEMSYASILEHEVFPQTLILAEGSKGSVKLDRNFEVKTTTLEGTTSEIVKPVLYPWVDPEYSVLHSSIVDAQQDILNGLRGGASETSGKDNLKTAELVFNCYESARTGDAKQFK